MRGWLFALAMVLWAPAPALAYERGTVEGVPDRGLFWSDRDIAIELASGSSTDVAAVDLHAAFTRALATWSDEACSDIVLSGAGEALGLSTNLVAGSDGLNRVVVREDGWPADVGAETLALTSIVYDVDTGAILDADVDLNGAAHTFAAGEAAIATADDVENTLTHELGHLLGFRHVSDPEATMFLSAALGETIKRDLGTDDIAALCETYPTGRPTPAIQLPMPRGCNATFTRRPSPSWALLALAISGLVRARWRRRARADETAS